MDDGQWRKPDQDALHIRWTKSKTESSTTWRKARGGGACKVLGRAEVPRRRRWQTCDCSPSLINRGQSGVE